MIYLESWFSWSRIDTRLQKNSWHVLFFSLFFSSFSFRARDWSTVIQLIKRLNRGNTWRRRPLFTLPHTKYRYTVCQKRVGPYVAPKFHDFFIGSTDIWTFDFKRNYRKLDNILHQINKETIEVPITFSSTRFLYLFPKNY